MIPTTSRFLRLLAFSLLALAGWTRAAMAQLEPPSTGGIVALEQELHMLGHNKRVLVIGAHPDDEDTELLTLLGRGMGAEAAYLSLNRGEGGQNLIGPELGEGLGLIRTEELLAARRLDGARQFFTRAYDFGFSKTLAETWRFWPRDSVLKDVVRIVREFRPQIIVSIFSGTPRDGHGQHQAAGWAAREAFRVAGDSNAFRDLAGEGLSPWSPTKLYQSTRFDSAATTLTLDGGQLDEVVGQSYHQIAMRGRSMHKSQDMGQLQRMGPSVVRMRVIEDRSRSVGDGLFSGIDTTIATEFPMLAGAVPAIDSAKASTSLTEIRRHLDAATPTVNQFCLRSTGSGFCDHFSNAVAIAHGLVFDAVADHDRVVAGDTLTVSISAWNGSDSAQQVDFQITTPGSFIPVSGDHNNRIPGRAVASWVVKILLPGNAELATPYFLRRPRRSAMYQWGPSDPRGEPFEEALLRAGFDGSGFSISREVVYRRNDQARGEVRMPITVVPRVDVKLDPANEVWSTDPGAHDFTVTLTHGSRDSTSGSVTLEVPAGWPAVTGQRFVFDTGDERQTIHFSIRPPAGLPRGKYDIRAVATDARGNRYDQGVFTVDYPHIRPRSWTRSSVATINVAPLDMARLGRVGYIRGAADRVPEALRSVGVPIELLDRTALERGDLSRFDAIVVGSRAYETDSALVENNGRLLEYARNGGLVIVQYQQQVFFNGHFAP
ncbi:MAG: PIG-L family deacetylase, partial [Gemmatimonadota bacterium]